MTGILSSNKISYSFEKPKHKVSLIVDRSATGKTTFYDLVRAHNNNPAIITLKWDAMSKLDLVYCNKNDMPYHLEEIKNSIIVVDEECSLLTKTSYQELANFIKKSSNYFFLITRQFQNLIGLSVSLQSIFYTKLVKHKLNKIVPYFATEQYHTYSNVVINHILCEDSKSSLFFFRDYYGFDVDKNLFSAGGKDKIIFLLEQLIQQGKNKILVVIDSCAFGLKMFEFQNLCKQYPAKNIYLLDWKSYEYYLLESKNINAFQEPKEPLFLEEKFYEFELKQHLLQYTKAGTNDTLPVCLNLDKRCIKTDCSYCTLCNSKIDDKFQFDKKGVYVHNPLSKFLFRPNDSGQTLTKMTIF